MVLSLDSKSVVFLLHRVVKRSVVQLLRQRTDRDHRFIMRKKHAICHDRRQMIFRIVAQWW